MTKAKDVKVGDFIKTNWGRVMVVEWDGAERYLNQIRKDKKTLIKLAKLIKKEKKNVL
mgnify:CR=1 FL=1